MHSNRPCLSWEVKKKNAVSRLVCDLIYTYNDALLNEECKKYWTHVINFAGVLKPRTQKAFFFDNFSISFLGFDVFDSWEAEAFDMHGSGWCISSGHLWSNPWDESKYRCCSALGQLFEDNMSSAALQILDSAYIVEQTTKNLNNVCRPQENSLFSYNSLDNSKQLFFYF